MLRHCLGKGGLWTHAVDLTFMPQWTVVPAMFPDGSLGPVLTKETV